MMPHGRGSTMAAQNCSKMKKTNHIALKNEDGQLPHQDQKRMFLMAPPKVEMDPDQPSPKRDLPALAAAISQSNHVFDFRNTSEPSKFVSNRPSSQ